MGRKGECGSTCIFRTCELLMESTSNGSSLASLYLFTPTITSGQERHTRCPHTCVFIINISLLSFFRSLSSPLSFFLYPSSYRTCPRVDASLLPGRRFFNPQFRHTRRHCLSHTPHLLYLHEMSERVWKK